MRGKEAKAMNRHHSSISNRSGSALLTVMLIVLISSVFLATVLSMSMGRAFMAKKLANRVRAIAIAEAGANQAYTVLATNFAARTDASAFPLTTYGDGSYDVSVSAISNEAASISSLGTCGDVQETVILDVMLDESGMPPLPEMPAFDYAMVAGGELAFNGTGNISGTNGTVSFHANGRMSVGGNAEGDVGFSSSTGIKVKNVTIEGDISAPDLVVHAGATITGSQNEQTVPLVDIPDIDLTPYFNWASAHSEVREGFNMSGGSYTPNGGILWVNGSVQLSSDYTFNGAIIATGAIHLTGTGSIVPTTTELALITRDGPQIRNQSTGLIDGLIYAKNGDYIHTANGQLRGQVIVKGDIAKGGTNVDLLFKQTEPAVPGQAGTLVIALRASAWQQ
jgi:cytoskeletal protein CcmA (bactofilin family)